MIFICISPIQAGTVSYICDSFVIIIHYTIDKTGLFM